MVDWLAGNRVRGTSTERTTSAGFNDVAAISGGWKELDRTTLGSAGDTISVSSLDDKRYYMILGYIKNTGGNTVSHVRVNSSTADYSHRRSVNGGTDATGYSDNRMFSTHSSKSIDSRFIHGYFGNKSDIEKLGLFNVCENGATGGTAPARIQGVGKHAQTSSALNEVRLFNDEAGSFDTGGELVVLGWDDSDTHSTNFWTELASVELGSSNSTLSSGMFTSKKYLWVQIATTGKSGTSVNSRLRVGYNSLDTGDNLHYRKSTDGGTDSLGNGDGIQASNAGSAGEFWNVFMVNNSSSEKLMIIHHIDAGSAGAGGVPRRSEIVAKWTNTSNAINILGLYAGGDTFNAGTTIKVWGSN